MTWLQLKFPVPADKVELLSDALIEAGALSVTLADQADQPIFEPAAGTTPLWQHTRVIALFTTDTQIDFVLNSLATQLATDFSKTYTAETIADQDWERVCLRDFHAMQFGNRLWICPSWETAIPEGGVQVLLDPGLAFGTGTHPTTALCLEWLDAHIKGGEIVIDYGCGSGILALAAYKLGASKVWAVDNDPQALQATLANSQANQVPANAITAILPTELPAIKADIVIANILAQPLIELAPLFANLVIPQGNIALSGILTSQTAKVLNNYQTWFKFSPLHCKQEWALLWGTKP